MGAGGSIQRFARRALVVSATAVGATLLASTAAHASAHHTTRVTGTWSMAPAAAQTARPMFLSSVGAEIGKLAGNVGTFGNIFGNVINGGPIEALK